MSEKPKCQCPQCQLAPCEYLTYGSRCSLKFYLFEDKYENVVKSCPLKKKTLLAGNECYHLDQPNKNW